MVVGRVEVEEQLVDLVEDFVGARIATVDLVQDDNRRQMLGEGLREHVTGLRQRALGRIDEQHDAVDHRQRPLDLTTEVGVPGRVDEVDLRAPPRDRCRLCEDRDAALALLVVRVHDAVDDRLVLTKHPGRAEHGVDEGGLPVVDMGDERDVTNGGGRHRHGCARGSGAAAVGLVVLVVEVVVVVELDAVLGCELRVLVVLSGRRT